MNRRLRMPVAEISYHSHMRQNPRVHGCGEHTPRMMGTPRFFLGQTCCNRHGCVPHKVQGTGAPVSGVMEGKNVIQLVPEYDDDAWQNVVIVNFNRDNRQVNVNAYDRSNDNSDYSVPVLRDSPSQTPVSMAGVCFFM